MLALVRELELALELDVVGDEVWEQVMELDEGLGLDGGVVPVQVGDVELAEGE